MHLAVRCLLATSDQAVYGMSPSRVNDPEAEVVHGPLGQVFYKKAAAYGFTVFAQGFLPHTHIS